MNSHDYLARLMADIACAPTADHHLRHDLLLDALAPLGDQQARQEADAIEAHAYRVRTSPRQDSADVLLDAEIDVAAYRVEVALTDGRAAA
jgi:exonuclease V gamma subunit